jgi:hypothetical protein
VHLIILFVAKKYICKEEEKTEQENLVMYVSKREKYFESSGMFLQKKRKEKSSVGWQDRQILLLF